MYKVLNIRRIIWIVSILISILFLFLIIKLLLQVNESYQYAVNQLSSPQKVQKYLEKHWEKKAGKNISTTYVPVGLFLQSIDFLDSNTVKVAGYIWEKIDNSVADKVEPGFIFPEGNNMKLYIAYKKEQKNSILYGWYFEGDLFEQFFYKKFPFDLNSVWIRIWPKEFDKAIILIPDLAAYKGADIHGIFGVDKNIVVQGYNIIESYFEYVLTDYDTNFGIDSYVGQKGYPELYFNVALKRPIVSIFVLYLLPMSIVLLLAFFSVLSLSPDETIFRRSGFTFSAVIIVAGTLIFITILAHSSVRANFPEARMVYIEYIYLVIYIAVLYLITNAFLLQKSISFLKFENNLISKALFIPFHLALILIISYYKLL